MQTYEEQKAKIARLNLMDDVFFQKVMQDLEICKEILRIILQMPNLKIQSNQIERAIPILTAKSVRLDLICEDNNGNIINVEVQKANDTDHQKRVRYNMACADTISVEKGLDYSQLPDLYVIYISAFDLFKQQKTIYHIQRTVKETGLFVENGTHEIYVNTKIDDGSDIAQLMQYFQNSNGIHPLFQKLSNQIYYYKETPEGVRQMSNVWEEYAQEYADEKVAKRDKETIIKMLKENIDISTINKILPTFSIDEIKQLQQELLQHA